MKNYSQISQSLAQSLQLTQQLQGKLLNIHDQLTKKQKTLKSARKNNKQDNHVLKNRISLNCRAQVSAIEVQRELNSEYAQDKKIIEKENYKKRKDQFLQMKISEESRLKNIITSSEQIKSCSDLINSELTIGKKIKDQDLQMYPTCKYIEDQENKYFKDQNIFLKSKVKDRNEKMKHQNKYIKFLQEYNEILKKKMMTWMGRSSQAIFYRNDLKRKMNQQSNLIKNMEWKLKNYRSQKQNKCFSCNPQKKYANIHEINSFVEEQQCRKSIKRSSINPQLCHLRNLKGSKKKNDKKILKKVKKVSERLNKSMNIQNKSSCCHKYLSNCHKF